MAVRSSGGFGVNNLNISDPLKKFVAKQLIKKDKRLELFDSDEDYQTVINGHKSEFYFKLFPQPRTESQPIIESSVIPFGGIINKALSFASSAQKLANKATQPDISEVITKASTSCSISKNIGEPANWTVSVKNTTNLHKYISPGDWVALYLGEKKLQGNIGKKLINQAIGSDTMEYGPNPSDLKIIGLIDRVQKDTNVDDKGTIIQTWTISGRDFGRIFQDTKVYISPFSKTKSDVTVIQLTLSTDEGDKTYADKLTGGKTTEISLPASEPRSPDKYVNKYIKTILGGVVSESLNLKIPSDLVEIFSNIGAGFGFLDTLRGGGNNLLDILNLDINSTLGHCDFKSLPTSTSMSLMEMIQSAQNAPWNEYYFEIVDGMPTFTFRPAVFNPDDLNKWAKYTAKKLPSHRIESQSLGISDHERINYLIVYPNTSTDKGLNYLTAASHGLPENPESQRLYSLKKYEVTTDFGQVWVQGGNVKSDGPDDTTLNKLKFPLAKYLFSKHKFMNGTVTVVGDNPFVLGDWINLTNNNIIAKVESIEYEWNFGEPIKTNMQLTHGMIHKPPVTDTPISTNILERPYFYENYLRLPVQEEIEDIKSSFSDNASNFDITRLS